MPNMLDDMPTFENEDEERAFWATRDSTDYVDWDKATATILPKLKPSTKSISLRLPEMMLNELRLIANKRDVPYQSLIKIFLKERIDEALRGTYTNAAQDHVIAERRQMYRVEPQLADESSKATHDDTVDDIASYNQARWTELVEAGVAYAKPYFDLDAQSAREVVDVQGIMGDVAGKQVLCLASGGGQQSVAFGLLGAKVTVFDLTEAQLAHDREAAAHYGLDVAIVQGDMRDLSQFADNTFDVVWHAYSINFVTKVEPVFQEIRRVLRPDGLYRIEFHNPFFQAVDEEAWNGDGYLLKYPYIDGADLTDIFPYWDVYDDDGTHHRIDSPKAYRHTLGTVMNNLIKRGFDIRGIWETNSPDANPNANPGSWEHFLSIAPQFLTLWAVYKPRSR